MLQVILYKLMDYETTIKPRGLFLPNFKTQRWAIIDSGDSIEQRACFNSRDINVLVAFTADSHTPNLSCFITMSSFTNTLPGWHTVNWTKDYTHQSRAPERISWEKYKREPWVWVYQGEKENNSKWEVHDSKQDLGGLQIERKVSTRGGGLSLLKSLVQRFGSYPHYSQKKDNDCSFTIALDGFLLPLPSANY